MDLEARGRELAQELLIVDTHVDLPYRLTVKMEDVSVRTEGGDFDYVRAREGGLDAPFMSIYVPASYQQTGGAREFADELIDMVEGLAVEHPDKFAIVASPDEVEALHGSGKLALALGMENGAPVEGDLGILAHFQERGIRYITLTHSENNQISDSSYSEERTWIGLSDFGREVVREMNRLGIMVDVSHVSDAAFDHVLEVSEAPVIASHSSCRHFTPGFERNMSDGMIRRLAAAGGVIHINFGSMFLREDSQKRGSGNFNAIRAFMEEESLDRSAPEVQAFAEQRFADHPMIFADLADVVDHIDHVVELVGIDHVGLGSDFDGVGDSLPTGLKDVSYFPNLITALLERGYSEEDIAKICAGNLMRVWRQVEAKAAELQDAGDQETHLQDAA